MRFSDEETQGPVIRDRRRIDPVTGQVRGQAGKSQPGSARSGQSRLGPAQSGPAPSGSAQRSAAQRSAARSGGTGPSGQPGRADPGQAGGPAAEAEPDGEIARMLAERTADMQRIQAEYANYRKRVDRDRVAVREQALANVLSQLLPVLDDIGRAREHGELVGGFKQVAEALEAATAKLGLTAYGESGDPFDPTMHEALMHSYSADVTEPTCVSILQPGYKVGERTLRPARVAVAEPEDDASGPRDGEQAGPGQDQPRDNDDRAAADQADGTGQDGHQAQATAGQPGQGQDTAGDPD